MPRYEFTGADPIDHFFLGRVTPGDVVELDEEPAGPWTATKKRLSRAQCADQSSVDAEHAPAAPSNAEEA